MSVSLIITTIVTTLVIHISALGLDSNSLKSHQNAYNPWGPWSEAEKGCSQGESGMTAADQD